MQLSEGTEASLYMSGKVRLSYLRKEKLQVKKTKEGAQGVGTSRPFKKRDDGQMSDESRTDQRQNVEGWESQGPGALKMEWVPYGCGWI